MARNQQVRQYRDAWIDFDKLSIRTPAGEQRLRLKPFQVLTLLVENHGRVIPKEEFFTKLWPDVSVTDDTLTQCIADIRRAFGDDARDAKYVRTIAKVGYQFIAEPAVADKPVGRRWIASAAAAILAAISLFAYVLKSRPLPPQAPEPKTIAIMPFHNASGSSNLDWLGEGIPDMLMTTLSRPGAVSVLGRDHLHRLLIRTPTKGRVEDAIALARQVKADAVVMGSFFTAGTAIRIDAHIYSAVSGTLLGSETLHSSSPEDVLKLTDPFAWRIAALAKIRPSSQTESTPATHDLRAYRLYSLAVAYANAFRNREAIQLLQQAIQIDPEFAMAHARIGYAYAVTWNLAEQAKPHLERAYKLSHRLNPKDRLLIEAWYSIANLDYPRAIDALRKVIRLEPLEVEAYLRAGNLLRGEERMEEAAAVLQQGLAVDPSSAELHIALSGVRADQERHDQAIENAKRAAALTPTDANAFDHLGIVSQWAGRFDEAHQAYNKAAELDPKSERPPLHLGNLYFQSGRYKEAIQQFQKYIALAPSNLERGRAWGRIAWVHWKQRNYAQAEAAAKRERELVPNAVFHSIVLALHKGDRKSVEKWATEIDKYNNTSRGARTSRRYGEFFKGYIALESGDANRALDHFKKALQHRPAIWSTDSYEDCLADAYLKLGRLPEAIAEYKRVLSRHPRSALARFHLAEALKRNGETSAAATEYHQFAKTWKNADPAIPELRAALARPSPMLK